MRALVCALSAVAALAIGAVAAGPAQAAPTTRALDVPFVPGPASSLRSVFTSSPAGLAQALLCPVGDVLAGATDPIPGVGALTDQLKSVLCGLSLLGYGYRTTYIPANGPPVVRYYRALPLVPALLDVNGDLLPDFSANITPNLTLNGLTLSINRMAIPASAKVKIEAVVLDPAAPDTYLGFGEDGTTAGTANQWRASVTAFGLSSSAVDLGLSLATVGAPASLAALGEVFSGSNPDAPDKVSRGNLGFTPVPSTFTTRIKATDSRQEALVTTPLATKVTGHVDVIRPGSEKNVDVIVDKLPSSLDLVHTTANGHENVTYAANAPVTALSAAYHERAGSSMLTAAQLDASGVPATLTYDQVGGKTTINAPGAALSSVEARYAKGDDVPAPGAGTGPYAAFHRYSSSRLTGGLRLTNLRSVAIDQSAPYSGELIFSSPLGALPLSAQDDVSGVTLTGTLSNLPLDTSVVLDTDNGIVTFDGHGTGIDRIALHATKTGGAFFARATRIDATVDGIPATETINFKQDGGSVGVAASNPPATISLLASDGSDAPAVDGSYAWFEDTPTTYRAFARISGLKGIAFGSSPVAGSFDTAAPQVLNLHGQKDDLVADGKIDQLPSHVQFNVLDDRIHFQSSGAIDELSLQAKGLPASAKFRNAKVDIFGISPVLDVYLGIDPATAGSGGGGGPVISPDAARTHMTRQQDCPPEGCDGPPDCDPTIPGDCDDGGGDGGGGGGNPPPPPPAPQLFGVDAHGHGVDLITAHAWADDADLALHPDLATNRSAMRHAVARQQNCPPEGCDGPPDCDPSIPGDCDGGDGGGGGGGCPCTPPPFPVPDTQNAILYDAKTPGHEDLRARIANLKHAFYTSNAETTGPNGYPAFNGTDNVDIDFTQPGDVTLGIRKDDIAGTITIPHVGDRPLPTHYGLKIGTKRVINAVFTPNVTIPTVQISMAAGKDEDGQRKALISGHLDNVPTSTSVCIAKDGFPDCGSFIGQAPGGDTSKALSSDIDFHLNSNGPPVTDANALSVSARVCLGDINSNAWVPASCLSDQTAKKYVDIDNLRVRNVHLEYADGAAYKYQGNFITDDSLAAFLNTDGILVDDFRYVKDGGKGVELVKSDQPLSADGFYAAVNYSASVRAGFMYGPIGDLHCPGDTGLYLLERDSVSGAVSRYEIPVLPDNLWDYVTLFIDC